MRRQLVNMISVLVIVFGGLTLATPQPALACPECPTCTGGCTGCFGAHCGGDTSPDCGMIYSSSSGYITCYKGSSAEPVNA